MSVYYSRTMTISCDRCIEAQSFTCPGEGTDWKEANEHFFRLGWELHKGKHLCPAHAAKRQAIRHPLLQTERDIVGRQQ